MTLVYPIWFLLCSPYLKILQPWAFSKLSVLGWEETTGYLRREAKGLQRFCQFPPHALPCVPRKNIWNLRARRDFSIFFPNKMPRWRWEHRGRHWALGGYLLKGRVNEVVSKVPAEPELEPLSASCLGSVPWPRYGFCCVQGIFQQDQRKHLPHIYK